MRLLGMNEAVGILRTVFPDHRPSIRYQVTTRDVLFRHAIWLGASVRVTELADRSRFSDADILHIMCDGPLRDAKRVVVFNAIGTEHRPAGAPQIRGAFLVEGESLDTFLEQYHKEIWRTLFEDNTTVLLAPDVEAAGILHDGWVVVRLGRPDFLQAIRRRRPGIEIRVPPHGGGAARWQAVVEGGDFIIACGDDESQILRQVSDPKTWSAGAPGAMRIAYLDQQTGMQRHTAETIEQAGVLIADRRSMDTLLDLVAPVQERVSKWDVESWARLSEPAAHQ